MGAEISVAVVRALVSHQMWLGAMCGLSSLQFFAIVIPDCNCMFHSLLVHTVHVFTQMSAAALIKFFPSQGRHLTKGSAYLKIGRSKEIFCFNLTVYLPSVRKITLCNRSLFIVAIDLFRYFSVVSSLISDLTVLCAVTVA